MVTKNGLAVIGGAATIPCAVVGVCVVLLGEGGIDHPPDKSQDE